MLVGWSAMACSSAALCESHSLDSASLAPSAASIAQTFRPLPRSWLQDWPRTTHDRLLLLSPVVGQDLHFPSQLRNLLLVQLYRRLEIPRQKLQLLGCIGLIQPVECLAH